MFNILRIRIFLLDWPTASSASTRPFCFLFVLQHLGDEVTPRLPPGLMGGKRRRHYFNALRICSGTRRGRLRSQTRRSTLISRKCRRKHGWVLRWLFRDHRRPSGSRPCETCKSCIDECRRDNLLRIKLALPVSGRRLLLAQQAREQSRWESTLRHISRPAT